MKTLKLDGSIWPDIDNSDDINNFLKKYGISVDFLLDDGLKFEYEEGLDVYYTKGSVFFRDAITKSTVLHYYEDFDKIVFETPSKQIYTIPIYDELSELL